MKAFLMYRDRDFDLSQAPPPREESLIQDLELPTLFAAMSRGDKWLAEVVKKAILTSSAHIDTIRYRQDILKDCLKREAVVREIYSLAIETIESERKGFWSVTLRYPNGILHRSVEVLQMLVGMLRRLRAIADLHIATFESEGFRTLFAMLVRELSDDYFTEISHHLKQLKFQHGALISAQIGDGNMGTNYALRRENVLQGSWLKRVFAAAPPSYSFQLHPRDESGARALSELRDRGINLVANALAQSTDHVVSFFNMLRTELAFYVGCLNLHGQLSAQGEPACFPQPTARDERRHSAVGLYDVCLALTVGRAVVGNEVNADGKDLVIITGANQGGKTTFLRAIGLAQLMMQCGMFVSADAFSANVCERIFTHFKREEDVGMNSGKFDEELSRMSDIADNITPDSLVLFNESFAATNEREGSEISRQIVSALIERHVKVVFITHQYEFAHGFQAGNLPNALFLRAERQPGGERTFKIIEGQPLQTCYGEDLYKEIFTGALAA
jgi:hypothetical protein